MALERSCARCVSSRVKDAVRATQLSRLTGMHCATGVPFGSTPLKIQVVPVRREMNPVVVIAVAVDKAGQRGEGQIKAIGRMREEQGVILRRLDGPEIVEFDHVTVGFGQRRAGNLAGIVQSDWRADVIDFTAWRQLVVPGERAVLDPQITDQRNEKAARHGVDERRSSLDRVARGGVERIVGLRRHRLEPVRQAERGRDGGWQDVLQACWTAENESLRLFGCAHYFESLGALIIMSHRARAQGRRKLELARFSNASSRLAAPKRKRRRVAETEGFEPSIGLYKPITV